MKKDNQYFDRFLQYIISNLIAAICYFLFAAILGTTGVTIGEGASRLLSSVVTALPFALAVFVSTLRDKTIAPRELGRYFATVGRGDMITYAIWAICGAMIAIAGEAAGITIYVFLAQTMPAAALTAAIGPVAGLPIAVVISLALYAAARVGGVMAKSVR